MKVPCTYASQPDEHQRRAVETIRDLFTAAILIPPTSSRIAAALETVWNADLQIGSIILELQALVPMRLHCPACGALHVDESPWDQQPHHTHACQMCGAVWRPAVVHTTGVRFLPGFKNDT